MKKKILIICMTFIMLFSLASCKRGERVVKDFPTAVSSLESYKVTGKLYSMFPSGTKECLITVYYKNPDYYRVEVDNSVLSDKQIVLKNSDGVQILIPSVNKTFKVKSSWPLNSSYPYLLQSLSKDLLSDENPITVHEEETSSVEIKAKVFEDAAPSTQKIVFDNKTGYPKEVFVYDENHNLVTRFVYEKIEVDVDLDDEMFNAEKVLTSMNEYYQDIVETYVRAITYPTYYPVGASLKEESIKGSLIKTAIMTYSGENSFTIIEQYLMPQSTVTTSYVDGDIYIMGGTIAVINSHTIIFGEQGVEYTIASSSLDKLEMIKMGDSLLVGSEK
ncbi:MAG: outer membrane lipoprotein carrier protein LolA [Bacilli bacterium]|nr:outer membrane lipoprotein carrier protein LolA [Bacilli bacterium]